MEQKPRVALLIDAENASAKTIEFVLGEVASHGVAHVRRAYGNWKDPALRPWEERLHEMAIRPIQQFAYSSKKNATDMALVIDAMDLMYAGHVDGFALMSSDGDFTPLVMRLLSSGKMVYGYGEEKTPIPFVSACSKFTYVDRVPDVTETPEPAPKNQLTAVQLQSQTRLINILRLAVEASQDDSGWAHLASVGWHISNQASLDPRNYGYKKLGELIEATNLFEIRRHNQIVKVRTRR